MKIVIITSEEPFYLPTFLARVAERRADDIAAIVLTPPIHGSKTRWEMVRLYRTLYGLRGFLGQAGRYVTSKALDRLSSLVPMRRFYSVARVARAHGIPLEAPGRVNDPAFLDRLEVLAPDLIVSVSSGQIFRERLLRIPRLGCLNVHSALLPRYRGLLPTFWVLANGEEKTGVTVHFMDESVDSGGIVLQRAVAIAPEETHHSLLRKTKRLGAELLLEALELIESGRVSALPNNPEGEAYYSFPTVQDVRRFRAAGNRFR